MAKEELRHTNLSVKERNHLIINGVINIESFDESYITLEIGDGRISVEGVGLKIESLSKEDGEILVSGKINGVFYNEKRKVGKFRGIFG